jgi:hypothetical protein
MTSVRDAARSFHHAHQDDWPTLENAAEWRTYVENLTELGTEWKKQQGKVSVVDPALSRVREVTAFTEDDLDTLNIFVADAEDEIDDVMFPVSVTPPTLSTAPLVILMLCAGPCRKQYCETIDTRGVCSFYTVHTVHGNDERKCSPTAITPYGR